MAESKYGKYVFREPIQRTIRGTQGLHFCGDREECLGAVHPGLQAGFIMHMITKPFLMEETPHAHDSDQIIFILGPNLSNLFEFDAEIELCLGEECEKQIIDTPAIVFIPKGMIHCPLEFTRVGKPIFFGHLDFASEYSRSIGDASAEALSPHRKLITKYTPEEADKMRGRTLRKH